jgi:hypothetical protein
MSRRSHISSDRGLVAVPKRWRRSSGWSPTTSRGTRPATESGCPERSFLLSLKFGSHSQRTPAVLLARAMTGHHRNVDSENRPAIAAGPSMPDKPPPYRSSPPTPSDFVDILPPPLYATYWGYLSQADTHLLSNCWPIGFSHLTPHLSWSQPCPRWFNWPSVTRVCGITLAGAATQMPQR